MMTISGKNTRKIYFIITGPISFLNKYKNYLRDIKKCIYLNRVEQENSPRFSQCNSTVVCCNSRPNLNIQYLTCVSVCIKLIVEYSIINLCNWYICATPRSL